MGKSKMEKYGFVYLWRDRKHKRYYIGCHWGSETDKYICSSRWMRKAYKRRSGDFKRRILFRVYTTRMDLLIEEYRWLSMIRLEELGKRYYNLRQGLQGHWVSNASIKERMSKARQKFLNENPE